jgi:hypothetical protein
MSTFLHIIWFSLPAIYVVIAVWAKLEAWSGKSNRGQVSGYLKQALFLFVCALLALSIEVYFLEDLVVTYLDPIIPLDLARIILLPLILLAAAQLLGGSKPIQIQSNRITREKKRKG